MRKNGALKPHNGALVTIDERDDEGGGAKVNKIRKTNVNDTKVGLSEVNKAIDLRNANKKARIQQQQQQQLLKQLQQQQQKSQQKQKEVILELQNAKEKEKAKITLLQQNSLITPTGSNKISKESNNNIKTNNNSTCSNPIKAYNKITKVSQSLIDESRRWELKENPVKAARKATAIPTPTTTAKAPINEPNSTSIKRGQSGRLGMLVSFIATGSASITAVIMRVLHVQKSLTNARINDSNVNDEGKGKGKVANLGSLKFNSNADIYGPQRSAVTATATATASMARYLGTFAFFLLLLLPCGLVLGDDGDNFFAVNSFSMGPDTTTPEFDYASRGQKKFGDKCENTLECGFPGSVCDPKKKSCQCTEDLPVTNHIDKCGKGAVVNESCFFNEQCEFKYLQTECRDGRCVCRFEMTPIFGKDGSFECKGRQEKRGPETYVDPAMIGVLVGMALMFIIICVVLRLFSQARWRENRTIFNTPNPRLMNVSLLRESKHGQERRGSRMSIRGPSRQPSMASLRPHSPNPSLGKQGSRSNSHGSNASATSLRSTRSNSVAPGNVTTNSGGHHERHGSAYYQHHHAHHHQQQAQQQPQPHHNKDEHATNITTNPVAESVTVEIMTPDK